MTVMYTAPAFQLPGDLNLSFELFPPKNRHDIHTLDEVVSRLDSLGPDYYSVTCGAGGDGATHTAEVVTHLVTKQDRPVVPHITCAGLSRSELYTQAERYADMGVERIVALRGDAPPHTDGVASSCALIACLQDVAPFSIAVGAYPETHPDAVSSHDDLAYLKRKQDAGATKAITQYCFDTETILTFRDRLRACNITMDLTIGVMPIRRLETIERFSARCGASVPAWVRERFQHAAGTPLLSDMIAAHLAAEQIRDLMRE